MNMPRAAIARPLHQGASVDLALGPEVPVSNLMTAAAISLNLWGWLAYAVWSVAF
jgi:hypothetical protein